MRNFIPRPYKKEPITVRIDIDKLEKIDKYLIKYKLNRSEFINRCIDFALDNIESDISNKFYLKEKNTNTSEDPKSIKPRSKNKN